MPKLTFDPQIDGPTPEMEAAAAAALAQGEKLYQMQEEDRARQLQQTEQETEQAELIAGKFKSQEDLLKAYKELEARLGKKDEEQEEEASEEPTEPSKEEEPTESSPVAEAILKASEEYAKGGLSEETIKELAKSDPEQLINTFVDLYSKQATQVQQQTLAAAEEQAIMQVAGGQEGYAQMIQWAADNLEQSEIEAYNSVTSSGNAAAIRFAAEALYNRFKSAEGYEAPLVRGKGKAPSAKVYRSQAELLRDLQNPLYDQDPAFRADVEARLAASGDLL